jgi:hypothetical protein
MSPKQPTESMTDPKTVTTKIERAEDERLERLLMQAKLAGLFQHSMTKSDFIREAIKQEIARTEERLRTQK